MERYLSLIKKEKGLQEKRIFPRFPFSTMTFKTSSLPQAFQVNDISFNGMCIDLKNGKHLLNKDDRIDGAIHWHGQEIQIKAKVVWAKEHKVGVAFENVKKIKKFLSIKNIVQGLRPLHNLALDLEIPSNLKYWLKASPILEIFVWSHSNGEYKKIQILFMNTLLEWEDGRGTQMGTLVGKWDRETPLSAQNEFTIEMAPEIHTKKWAIIHQALSELPEDKVSPSMKKFMLLKFAL